MLGSKCKKTNKICNQVKKKLCHTRIGCFNKLLKVFFIMAMEGDLRMWEGIVQLLLSF